MVHSTRIALLGFGRIEHAAFEAFFRVASRRCPAYAQEDDFRAADFVIVDAADPSAREAVRAAGLAGRAVVLGGPRMDGALLQMARPLNLMQVVRALDAVLANAPVLEHEAAQEGRVVAGPDEDEEGGRLAGPGSVAGALRDAEPDTVRDGEPDTVRDDAERDTVRDEALDAASDTALDDVAQAVPETAPDRGPDAAAEPPPRGAQAAADATLGLAREAATVPPGTRLADPGIRPGAGVPGGGQPAVAFAERRRRPRGAPMEHILVVDDSDIALRFMATHLQRFGFQIHLAKSGEEALRRVAGRRFEFVFLDVRMEGLDGFQTCKAIKRASYPPGQTPPTVVMLTCLAGPADRLRGTMAGADAYLVKPLREVELLKVVGEREIARHAYAETAAVSTMR